MNEQKFQVGQKVRVTVKWGVVVGVISAAGINPYTSRMEYMIDYTKNGKPFTLIYIPEELIELDI